MSPAMSTETREGLLRAAQACHEAEIRGAERMLQIVADNPERTDRDAEQWLSHAWFACDCIADLRFWGDRVLSGAATEAAKVCRDEEHASLMRRTTGRAP